MVRTTYLTGLLAEVRQREPHLDSLLMDRETLLLHRERMVNEAESYSGLPENLTEQEISLYNDIRNGNYGHTRLEKERLSVDYVFKRLVAWVD